MPSTSNAYTTTEGTIVNTSSKPNHDSRWLYHGVRIALIAPQDRTVEPDRA